MFIRKKEKRRKNEENRRRRFSFSVLIKASVFCIIKAELKKEQL